MYASSCQGSGSSPSLLSNWVRNESRSSKSSRSNPSPPTPEKYESSILRSANNSYHSGSLKRSSSKKTRMDAANKYSGHSGNWNWLDQWMEERYWDTPTASRPGELEKSPFTPAKSECSRSLFSGYTDYPNYMAYTESSRAKVRSQSAPKQRLECEKSSWIKRPSAHGFGGQQAATSLRSFPASWGFGDSLAGEWTKADGEDEL
ncbi:hypothetical protein HPP92_022039 [Vanilla planifolia]|uniref:DUF4005 domain-containing protein n=1 Tax=Vanilla planifolia TaxID=51239 RepID=A0A835PUZ1_VANPL|nr:hypothetical protein HPP92_022039 [Vanilla planifolia]